MGVAMSFNVVVAGGRDFCDARLMMVKLDKLFERVDDVCIISGGARGADKLGERYALSKGYPYIIMPADWDRYGKSAGYRRNQEMAERASACVVFWDGKSRGSKHMIDICEERDIPLRVVRYD
jgi:hypothetical protein